MLAINTDYNSDGEDSPVSYLDRIADAGFSHIHWCHLLIRLRHIEGNRKAP